MQWEEGKQGWRRVQRALWKGGWMRMEWEERETQGAEGTRWQERCSQVLLLSSLYWKVWDFPHHGAGVVFSSLSFLHWRQVLEDSSMLKGWKIHSSRQNEVLTSILKGMKGQLNRHLGHWTVLSMKRWEEQCRNTQRLPQGLRADILSTSQAPNPLTRLENIPRPFGSHLSMELPRKKTNALAKGKAWMSCKT